MIFLFILPRLTGTLLPPRFRYSPSGQRTSLSTLTSLISDVISRVSIVLFPQFDVTHLYLAHLHFFANRFRTLRLLRIRHRTDESYKAQAVLLAIHEIEGNIPLRISRQDWVFSLGPQQSSISIGLPPEVLLMILNNLK